MKLLKRKDSLTFKREKPLAKQERIYQATRGGVMASQSRTLWALRPCDLELNESARFLRTEWDFSLRSE